MKQSDIVEFIEYLKKIQKNKFYISEEFINWYMMKFEISELDAMDIYDVNSKKIIKKIIQYIDGCNDSYIVPEFTFDFYDSDILIGGRFSYREKDRVDISNKIEFRDKFFNLLKQIEWRELEKLSKFLLSENHIENIVVTHSTNDQGIDFYGYYTFKSEDYVPRFYKYLNFRIIGQVKHSNKNIGVDHQKVASFGTEINKLRKSKEASYFVSLDQEFLKSELPIVGIFITNSYYPKKTIDFAKEYGIIYWNGKQIAEDLSNESLISNIFDSSTQELSLEKFKKYIDLL